MADLHRIRFISYPVRPRSRAHEISCGCRSQFTDLSEEQKAVSGSTKYHLMCSTQHDGNPESGSYRVFVHFKANDQWCEGENASRTSRKPFINILVPSCYDEYLGDPNVILGV